METQTVNQAYEQYIINAIETEGYEQRLYVTNKEKLQFLYDTFISEYGYEQNLQRYGSLQNVFKEYLAGLPSCINIVFYNHDIIELAKKMGSLDKNSTQEQEERVIANYFNFMANKVFQLFKKYEVMK